MFFDRGEARRQRGRSSRRSGHFSNSDGSPEPLTHWLAYREDNRGNRYLIAAGLSDEAAADAKIGCITANHRKPHGQEYYKARYPEDALRATIERLNIIE